MNMETCDVSDRPVETVHVKPHFISHLILVVFFGDVFIWIFPYMENQTFLYMGGASSE